MATESAVETLNALRTRWEADKNRQTGALTELQEALDLPEPPNRIEVLRHLHHSGRRQCG